MPIKSFICPDGERIDVQECLAEGGCRRENRCATRGYLQLVSQERPWTGKPSVTMCINGTMRSWLLLTQQYAVSPDDRAFMIHGTKGHAVLESVSDPHSIMEQKLDGEETGIFDNLEFENGKYVLVENKTSGSYMVAKALGWYTEREDTGVLFKSGPRKGQPRMRTVHKRDDSRIDRRPWELQLNNYRMKVEKLGLHIDEIRVMCAVRDGNTYIARSRGVFRNIYYFKVRRMPDDEVSAYFRRKRNALAIALKHGWTTPCSAEENWDGIRCKSYCEVAEFCPFGKYLKKEKELENMPIEGVSDVRWLPRQGWIGLGEMRTSAKSGKEHPAELDYFVLRPATPNEEESARLVGKFHQLYGDKPKSIKIMLPSSDTELVFPQYHMRYGSSSGLKCRGDGKKAVCMSQEFTEGLEVTGEVDGLPTVVCKGVECPYQTSKPVQCSRVAKLHVLLPDLEGAGVWIITTGSFYSIVNVNSWIDYVKNLTGRAHMMPFMLERREQQITKDGRKTTHWPLSIDTSVPLAQLGKWAAVEEKEVLLKLPELSENRQELVYEITQESTIHEPGQEPEKEEQPAAKGELTYHTALTQLATKWAEEPGSVQRFMLDHCGTEAKALILMKKALKENTASVKMFADYDLWVEALKESGTEDAEEADFEIVEEEEKTEEPPQGQPTTQSGDVTYDSGIESLAVTWADNAVTIGKFMDAAYDTKAQALLAMRKIGQDTSGQALKDLFSRYTEWRDKTVDEAAEDPDIALFDAQREANAEDTEGEKPTQPTEPRLIEQTQLTAMKAILPHTGLGQTFRNKKFTKWWRDLLKKNEGTELLNITYEEAEAVIEGLNKLTPQKGGGEQGKLAL